MSTQVWIALVEPVGEKFRLSPHLLDPAGPLGWGGNWWQVKAFVAHLISHFDGPFEHLLDNEDDGDDDDPSLFHISDWFCEDWGQRYASEFLPVNASWYRDLIRAKLLSLRVPRELVLQAKLAWFVRCESVEVVAHGLVDYPTRMGRPLPAGVVEHCREAADAEPARAWTLLEGVAAELLATGTLTPNELESLMTEKSIDDYNATLDFYGTL